MRDPRHRFDMGINVQLNDQLVPSQIWHYGYEYTGVAHTQALSLIYDTDPTYVRPLPTEWGKN